MIGVSVGVVLGKAIEKNTTKYTYTNIDKYGNWTARSYTSILVASEDGSSPVKSSYKGSQTRKITYYER